MGLFDKTDGKGLDIDLGTVLQATGAGLSGFGGVLEQQQPEPEVDWTMVVVVGAVGLGLVVLLTTRKR